MSVWAGIIIVSVLMAWVIPLGIGIGLLRGPNRTAGVVLTVIGGLWALPSIATLVLGAVAWSGARSAFEVKDFSPAAYHGPTGLVRCSYPGESTLVTRLRGAKEQTRYTSSNGEFRLPVGEHTIVRYTAVATEPGGQKWEGTSRTGKTLAVSTEAPQQLTLGPPYRASVKAGGTNPSRLVLALDLRGAGGESVTISRQKASAPPPRFEMIDSGGRVVHSGKFAYG